MPNQNLQGVKKGFLSKLTDGFSNWFHSLIGKPRSSSVIEKATSQPPQEKKTTQEDSVIQDIKTFKSFLSRQKNQIFKNTPFPELSQPSVQLPQKVKGGGGGILGKIIVIILVILFILVVVFAVFRVTQFVGDNRGDSPISTDIPTPVQYRPYIPSLWAEDSEVKSLDEDINVLKRELSGTNIREIILNPPTLDFNIKFE